MFIKFGERLQEVRNLNHLTQKEIADYFNISRDAVNAWEMGVSLPSSKRIFELAKLLHTSIDYLFGLEDDLKVNVSSLNQEEIEMVLNLIDILIKSKNNQK